MHHLCPPVASLSLFPSPSMRSLPLLPLNALGLCIIVRLTPFAITAMLCCSRTSIRGVVVLVGGVAAAMR